MFWKKEKNIQGGENTFIIVGLGNPGMKYEKTRHNIGFMAIDKLAREFDISVTKIKHNALLGEGKIGNKKIILVKPQTFMNLSGKAVASLVRFYKIDLKNLLIIYDDVDIAPKEIRIREKGSGGTHNGMKSIVGMLGSNEFPRIRLGIGNSQVMEIHDYVLGKFSSQELKDMEKFLDKVNLATEELIKNGVSSAMNKYNGQL